MTPLSVTLIIYPPRPHYIPSCTALRSYCITLHILLLHTDVFFYHMSSLLKSPIFPSPSLTHLPLPPHLPSLPSPSSPTKPGHVSRFVWPIYPRPKLWYCKEYEETLPMPPYGRWQVRPQIPFPLLYPLISFFFFYSYPPV